MHPCSIFPFWLVCHTFVWSISQIFCNHWILLIKKIWLMIIFNLTYTVSLVEELVQGLAGALHQFWLFEAHSSISGWDHCVSSKGRLPLDPDKNYDQFWIDCHKINLLFLCIQCKENSLGEKTSFIPWCLLVHHNSPMPKK